MGLVRELISAESGDGKQHKDLHRCTYEIFNTAEGTRLFQLNSYGTEDRKHPEKVSQTLQFNEESAKELINALRRAFPALS